jgi:hypothetical protein
MILLDKMEVVQITKSNNYKYSFNLNIMKLKVLNSLEPLNSQELQFVVGGQTLCHTSKKHGRPHSDTIRKDEGSCETINN